jgi:hypothetical protein
MRREGTQESERDGGVEQEGRAGSQKAPTGQGKKVPESRAEKGARKQYTVVQVKGEGRRCRVASANVDRSIKSEAGSAGSSHGQSC